MADEILTHYKQAIKGMTLEPSSGGCFELSVNDKLVYSKLENGRFPEDGEILARLAKISA